MLNLKLPTLIIPSRLLSDLVSIICSVPSSPNSLNLLFIFFNRCVLDSSLKYIRFLSSVQPAKIRTSFSSSESSSKKKPVWDAANVLHSFPPQKNNIPHILSEEISSSRSVLVCHHHLYVLLIFNSQDI